MGIGFWDWNEVPVEAIRCKAYFLYSSAGECREGLGAKVSRVFLDLASLSKPPPQTISNLLLRGGNVF